MIDIQREQDSFDFNHLSHKGKRKPGRSGGTKKDRKSSRNGGKFENILLSVAHYPLISGKRGQKLARTRKLARCEEVVSQVFARKQK
jgi:hypothetical protein